MTQPQDTALYLVRAEREHGRGGSQAVPKSQEDASQRCARDGSHDRGVRRRRERKQQEGGDIGRRATLRRKKGGDGAVAAERGRKGEQ